MRALCLIDLLTVSSPFISKVSRIRIADTERSERV